ncbi:ESPR-type extended signal peptide-containing protein [Caballeronia telluris]|uniref:ESPR-type extended signal peptide-containing protein n=1 Tax=Caballeronia telluris TaxID=326475 RepID=UPI000AFA9FE2|nr:ESPR-type extended signal peptide-containing protein [Caballeronia telluris]
MNKNNYRLVFSGLRKILVAVEETETTTGKGAGPTTARGPKSHPVIFSLRQIAFAAPLVIQTR